MNERIKLLAEQAGSTHKQSLGVYQFYSDELEKFAELIVKETMRVVANNLPSNTYLDVADAVIEHFGVKE
jgi:hypothetical protein